MNPLPPKKYADYTLLVDGNVLFTLEEQAIEFSTFLTGLKDLADFAYAPGKWTIKEIAGHIIDTERILVYRLTAIIRAEQAPLPGFDEDQYVLNARFHQRTLQSYAEEFSLLRRANLYLFRTIAEEELNRTGIAAGQITNAGKLLATIAGHVIHHTNIIKERYL